MRSNPFRLGLHKFKNCMNPQPSQNFTTPIKLEDSSERVTSIDYVYDPEKHLKSLQSQFKVIHPQLKCPSDHQIVSVCISPACQADDSLICNQYQCQICSTQHERCGTFAKLKFISRQLQEHSQARKDFILDLYRREEEMIRKIRQRRSFELRKHQFSFLNSKLEGIINNIYVKNRPTAIKAVDAISLMEQIKATRDGENQLKKELMINFQKELEIIALRIKYEEKSLTDQFFLGKIQPQESRKQIQSIQSSELRQEQQDNGHEIASSKRTRLALKIQSKQIPTHPGTLAITIENSKLIDKYSQGWNLIQESLNHPKRIVLLYRASEHGFSASKFHKYCDNIPHTLTIIRTQFNKTIGGYTPLRWSSALNHRLIRQQSRKSFIFSVDLNQKMQLVDPKSRAIKSIKQTGPNFGIGYDIAISDKCDTNDQSYARFPGSYNHPSKYSNNQGTWTAFCGAPKGCSFKVLEYEVYRVQW